MVDKIKFAHLADLHLGAYREKKLTRLNFLAFEKTVEILINEKIDFCLISGDIFNSPVPDLEIVINFTTYIKKLVENNIKIYVIEGSHDLTYNNKSFINLLEKTNLIINVSKILKIDKDKFELPFFIEPKTKTLICGICGLKNNLEQKYFKNLKINKNNFNEDNLKIFMFHSTIKELLPENLNNIKTNLNLSFLPKGFNYYAGGHIHKNIIYKKDNVVYSYSGALFPNNFDELKRYKPVFNICLFDKKTKKLEVKKKELDILNVKYLKIDLDSLTPFQAKAKILEKISKEDFKDKILLLEIFGIIDGKISDIQINNIILDLYEKGVFLVLKNTYKLKNHRNDLEKHNLNLENTNIIEEKILNLFLKKNSNLKSQIDNLKKLFEFDFKKMLDEKQADYNMRVLKIYEKIYEKELN